MQKINKPLLYIAAVLIAAVAVGAAALYRATSYVVPVLMYHSIDNNDRSSKLSVSPEDFEKQMRFLRGNNYNVIHLEEAVPYLQKKARPPQKTIAVTFDDGYENNYTSAYPALKKYKIPAAIFVIVDKVGSPGYLTWDQIRLMSDSGLVDIGSHTRSHFWLLGSSESFLADELSGSKNILEAKLGKKTGIFCYPMGAFDEKSKLAVERAGYACAVATNPKGMPTDVFAIKRIKVSGSCDNAFTFWAKTTRLYTWFKRL